MRNKSEKTYTSINISNSKLLLTLGAVVAVVIDALITVLLCVGGYSFKFIAFPAVLLLLDVIYVIVGVTATNYRFRYSIGVWLVYVLLTCAACTSGTIILLKLEGTVLTNVALILWAAVHAVSVICAIVNALYTSKKFTSGVLTVIITLLLSAICAFYAVFLFTKGFFGQGYGLRTLVYDYDAANDSYTVSGVLSGNSEKVEIEKTFNGKPVTKIKCSVFTDNTVKEYVLHDNFELADTFVLANGSVEGKQIFVDAQNASSFRTKLFGCANGLQNRANALALANSTLPYDLEENKGFLAFDYDETAYSACGGNVMPLIIGDRGASVSLSSYETAYEYLAHTDKNDVADLKWGYENCNGYILDSIVADGNSLIGGYVLAGGANAKVEFEKVYRIYVQSGNDTKYDLRSKQTAFCCDNLNGTTLDYRYVAESNADSFFDNFTQREGFALVWKYGEEGSTTKYTLNTLAEALTLTQTSKLELYPQWTLNYPTVELQRNYTITYGDDLTFTVDATSPAEGISLVYDWRHGGINVGRAEDLSLTTPSLSGGYDGEYVLTVTTDGGEVTSLTSSVQKSLNLAINKKTVSFNWELPAEADRVYSGETKTVTVSFDDAQLVGSDTLDYKLKVNTIEYDAASIDCTNAADYYFSVIIDDFSAKNYQIDNTGAANFTIDPLPVAVTWSDYDFTYNGRYQVPSASALGVANDDFKQLVASVDGSRANAGKYTASAICVDGNYTLTNDVFEYTIKKAPLTVKPNDCTTVYGVSPIEIGEEYTGLVNGEKASVLGGTLIYSFTNASKNVGVYENCVEISGLSSINYDITYVPGNLEIIQRAVTVSWQNATNLVYNGESKNVTAIISNKVASDDVTAEVTGGDKVNAGSYTAEIVSLSGSSAGNYKLIEVLTKSYTIEKAKVTITADGVSAVYGDSEKDLSAKVSGEIYNNDFTYTLTRQPGNTVGTYIISVDLSGDYNSDYEVTCNSSNYTISARPVTLSWSGYENLVYDGAAKTVTATLGNVVGEEVYAVISGGSRINAGTYTATVTLGGSLKENYVLPAENTLKFTIAQRLVTLTWSGYENLTYNARAKSVTATLDNIVGGDSIYVEVTGGNQVNAGSYTASASIAGSSAGNYNVSGVLSRDYTINRAEITLKANDATSVYGEPTASLSVQLIGTNYNNEVRYTPETAVLQYTSAGTYDITVSVGKYANYTITVQNGTYTVTKATPQLVGFTQGGYTVGDYVEYGKTLGDVTDMLPAQSVSGSWVWRDGDGKAVGEVGTNTFNVTFVPNDSRNYNSVSASVTVNVKKVCNLSAEFSGEGVINAGENAYTVKLNDGSAPVTVTLKGTEGLEESLLSVVFKTEDGQTLPELKLTDGVVTFSEIGIYLVTFAYAGDQNYFSYAVTYKISVMAADPVIVG